jgi:protein-tyrosine kinase
MGRVDDAMRRAAGKKVDEPDSATALTARTGSSVEEPFPIEAPPSAVQPGSRADVTDPQIVRPTSATASGSRVGDSIERHLTSKLVADHTMAPESREQYRRLAATLHHTQVANGLKVVMIASAVAGEGKTLTAANLALTFSESYRRTVLLIDGDLRRPSVHTVFKIDGAPGLSDGLMSVEHPKLPLHQVSERLSILPAGRPSSDPMAGLTSRRMRQLLDEARDAFDWIIIDTPPVGLMTDANLLSAMTDGTLLVVKAGSTPYVAVQRAAEAIGRDRLLGTVLNRATRGVHHGQKYYDYYYGRGDAVQAD